MNYRTHMLAVEPMHLVTGAAPFDENLDPRISDEDQTMLQLLAGDPLDAPEWIPAGSTVGMPYSWCGVFTPMIHREA